MRVPHLYNGLPALCSFAPSAEWGESDIRDHHIGISQAYVAAGMAPPFDGQHEHIPGFVDDEGNGFQVSLDVYETGLVAARFQARLAGKRGEPYFPVMDSLIESVAFGVISAKVMRQPRKRYPPEMMHHTPGHKGSLAFATHFILEACQQEKSWRPMQRRRQLIKVGRHTPSSRVL